MDRPRGASRKRVLERTGVGIKGNRSQVKRDGANNDGFRLRKPHREIRSDYVTEREGWDLDTSESKEIVWPSEGFGFEGIPLASLRRLFDQAMGLGSTKTV